MQDEIIEHRRHKLPEGMREAPARIRARIADLEQAEMEEDFIAPLRLEFGRMESIIAQHDSFPQVMRWKKIARS